MLVTFQFDLNPDNDNFQDEERAYKLKVNAENYFQAISDFSKLLRDYRKMDKVVDLDHIIDEWNEGLDFYKIDPWEV